MKPPGISEKAARTVTPVELMFGGAVNLDRKLFTNKPIKDSKVTSKPVDYNADQSTDPQTVAMHD